MGPTGKSLRRWETPSSSRERSFHLELRAPGQAKEGRAGSLWGPKWPHKHKDPTNYKTLISGISLTLSFGTRM